MEILLRLKSEGGTRIGPVREGCGPSPVVGAIAGTIGLREDGLGFQVGLAITTSFVVQLPPLGSPVTIGEGSVGAAGPVAEVSTIVESAPGIRAKSVFLRLLSSAVVHSVVSRSSRGGVSPAMRYARRSEVVMRPRSSMLFPPVYYLGICICARVLFGSPRNSYPFAPSSHDYCMI